MADWLNKLTSLFRDRSGDPHERAVAPEGLIPRERALEIALETCAKSGTPWSDRTDVIWDGDASGKLPTCTVRVYSADGKGGVSVMMHAIDGRVLGVGYFG